MKQEPFGQASFYLLEPAVNTVLCRLCVTNNSYNLNDEYIIHVLTIYQIKKFDSKTFLPRLFGTTNNRFKEGNSRILSKQ